MSTERQNLETSADRLWAQCIISLYPKGCVVCHAPGVQAAHLTGRRNRHMRWKLLNGLALCPEHHDWLDGRGNEYQSQWMDAWLNRKCYDRRASLAAMHLSSLREGTVGTWLIRKWRDELREALVSIGRQGCDLGLKEPNHA